MQEKIPVSEGLFGQKKTICTHRQWHSKCNHIVSGFATSALIEYFFVQLEIAPTPEPSTTTTTTDEEVSNEYEYDSDDDEAPVARGGIPIDETTNDTDDKPQSTPEDVQGRPKGSQPDDTSDNNEPGTKTSDETTAESDKPATSQESEDKEVEEESNQSIDSNDDSSDDFTTVAPDQEEKTAEEERVNINFVTTAPTQGPKDPKSRITTTTQPRTKGKTTCLITR